MRIWRKVFVSSAFAGTAAAQTSITSASLGGTVSDASGGGRGYGFFRNQRFDARNPIFTRKDPLTQAQYGATGAGPLARNRTFLFANFEQARQNAAGFVTIGAAEARAIESAIGRPVHTGEYPSGLDTATGFARVDHHAGAARLYSARYAVYDVASENARSVGGLNDVSRGSNLFKRDHTLALSALHTISATTLLEVRAQFTRSRLAAPANDPHGPAINISGVVNVGTAVSSPTARDNGLFEAAASLATVRGRHTWKLGGGTWRTGCASPFRAPGRLFVLLARRPARRTVHHVSAGLRRRVAGAVQSQSRRVCPGRVAPAPFAYPQLGRTL